MSAVFANDNTCSWKFVLNSSNAQFNTEKLSAYLHSKVLLKGFPKLIFCDHIPEEQEMVSMFDNLPVHDHQPHILVLTDKRIKLGTCCWPLLKHGFEDVIEWEGEQDMISYIQSKYDRKNAITQVLESSLVANALVGNSVVWKQFLSGIIEATLFSQASILLIGESGTGKELISQLVHSIDKRFDKKKLIIVDCTTISPELSGSELFGHERGSYTSAIQTREGAFALANGGTLFLDEVGELPLRLQAELLRVLQEGTFKKVGSNNWQKTTFRLVCATNKDLRKAVAEGKFRQDLYFRIADCEFLVPPLNERKDDIPSLVNFFLLKFFDPENCPEVGKPVMEYLIQRDYPGNIRELKQLVQRIALKHVQHRKITIGEVPGSDRNQIASDTTNPPIEGLTNIIKKALLTGENWWNLKEKISETAIQVALDLESNNKQKAAGRLGIDVRTVQQYVKKKG